MLRILSFLLLLTVFGSCKTDSARIPTSSSENGVMQAVIEIPAGTNAKMELNTSTNKIEQDKVDGKNRVIDFLPYPANYGYIPGTMMDKSKGGDGDALDVFVLCSQVKSGTVLGIKPIGVLNVKDGGELDSKIIAIPNDPAQRTMKIENFADLVTEYHMAQQILQTWVLGYKGMGKTELIGWEDESAAQQLIKEWSK